MIACGVQGLSCIGLRIKSGRVKPRAVGLDQR